MQRHQRHGAKLRIKRVGVRHQRHLLQVRAQRVKQCVHGRHGFIHVAAAFALEPIHNKISGRADHLRQIFRARLVRLRISSIGQQVVGLQTALLENARGEIAQLVWQSIFCGVTPRSDARGQLHGAARGALGGARTFRVTQTFEQRHAIFGGPQFNLVETGRSQTASGRVGNSTQRQVIAGIGRKTQICQ